MKKKLFVLGLSVLMIFSMAACGGGGGGDSEKTELVVIDTEVWTGYIPAGQHCRRTGIELHRIVSVGP